MENFNLQFGQFKGQEFKSTPLWYQEWLQKQSWFKQMFSLNLIQYYTDPMEKEIITKANEIIDRKFSKLEKVKEAGNCQLVMAGAYFDIYISLQSNSVYAICNNSIYRLK
jgi:hypothetical protein